MNWRQTRDGVGEGGRGKGEGGHALDGCGVISQKSCYFWFQPTRPLCAPDKHVQFDDDAGAGGAGGDGQTMLITVTTTTCVRGDVVFQPSTHTHTHVEG